MAGSVTPTNERIVELLEEVKAQLADAKRRDERIAEEIRRLRAG